MSRAHDDEVMDGWTRTVGLDEAIERRFTSTRKSRTMFDRDVRWEVHDGNSDEGCESGK